MTRVLVYGDSNSWGTPPDGSGIRYDTLTRWPAVMAATLGWDLAEDCLPGRTTRHDDPEMLGPAMNGLAHLPVALKSQSPVDWLVIMLGTNDLKSQFSPSAQQIADGLMALVALARQVGSGKAGWEDTTPPRIALIAPPLLGALAHDANWPNIAKWQGGWAVSGQLAATLAPMAAGAGIAMFDAAQVVTASPADPIHIDAAAHVTLGKAVAAWLADL